MLSGLTFPRIIDNNVADCALGTTISFKKPEYRDFFSLVYSNLNGIFSRYLVQPQDFYLSVMAATKQVILHSPHPLQRSLSISKVLEIACCGQAVWQSGQV